MSISRRRDILPSIGIVFSSGLWGLFWLPIRAIEEAGVAALWTGPVIFTAVSLVLLPVALIRFRHLGRDAGSLILTGALTGSAFALYAVSFNMTDIIRALLLFYVSPVWSTMLGLLFLGERFNVNRLIALIMGLGGLVVVLGDGGPGTSLSVPWPRNVGDWFALASGLCWSFGSVRLFQGGATRIFEKIFAFIVGATIAGSVLALLPLGLENTLPDIAAVQRVWVWIAGVVLFLLPATWMTIWPASVLSPARVGILFMTEALVGIASAAWLTEEPFGAQHIAGAGLIVGAGIVEVLRKPD